MPRFFCPLPLAEGRTVELPEGAVRHAQVLRLQPGSEVTLFDGEGGEYDAVVERMGRSSVAVTVGAHHAIEREAARAVHLAVGMPANERMDWLVEKAAELGVASLQPLVTERSVVRLAAERATRKQQHWRAIAIAACEQCGRNRVPVVHEPVELARWLEAAPAAQERVVLSFAGDARPASSVRGAEVLALSGPEGGLSAAEEARALAAGFAPVSLGPRVLRAETAALALAAVVTLGAP